jgi:alkylated DNA repair dioxygenase AlkB
MQEFRLKPDGFVRYLSALFDDSTASELFLELRASLDWQQRSIMMFGKAVVQPRLVAFHGNPGWGYRYSGATLRAPGWTPPLLTIQERLTSTLGVQFNSVLCNLYRNGADSVGWHADSERDLGDRPLIASVSFGAQRRFVLKSRDSGERIEFMPEHGSLLVMGGDLQKHWLHQVPRTRSNVGERINLTFRTVSRRHC